MAELYTIIQLDFRGIGHFRGSTCRWQLKTGKGGESTIYEMPLED